MSESRVAELLKRSRSRHQLVVSRELRRVSVDYRNKRREAQEANQQLRKMMSEVRYFEALDQRLGKSVSSKRKELNGAQSIRERYLADLRRKERLEQLRQQELRKNRMLSNKIKEERNRRIEAVKRNRLYKQQLANFNRRERERLMDQRASQYQNQMAKNKSRVETVVEFECNLKQSYIKKKESQNSRFIKLYRSAIEEDDKTVQLSRNQTEHIRNKLKSLTEKTARKLTQMQELMDSIKKFKPSTPHHHSPIFNREKLMEKSRCYTETSSVYDHPNSHDCSVFISRQPTDPTDD